MLQVVQEFLADRTPDRYLTIGHFFEHLQRLLRLTEHLAHLIGEMVLLFLEQPRRQFKIAADAVLHRIAVVQADEFEPVVGEDRFADRQSTRLNSSHYCASRMPSPAR